MELDNARDSIHAAGDYVAITAKVKSACRGVNIETATLEDLTEETWSNRVERLLLQLWKKKPGYNLSVVLERIINISKRPSCFMDDPVSPAERKTRTVQQEIQQQYRRDQNEDAGDFTQSLQDRWQCHSDRCVNLHGFRYVLNRKHYRIKTSQKEEWAKRITIGVDGTIVDFPGGEQLGYFLDTQGAVGERYYVDFPWIWLKQQHLSKYLGMHGMTDEFTSTLASRS